MAGGQLGSDNLAGGKLTLRAAVKDDLDSIAQVVVAGLADDTGCDYRFPYRHEHADDFWKWTRLEYEEYLNQPEKFVSLVVTAPIEAGTGIINEVIAIGVWDVAVETKSTGGDRGIHERRDANPEHMRVHLEAILRGVAKHFVVHGKEQLSLRMLITHPDFRRRGAGTLLCDWGQQESIKRGWILTVMASPMGRALYERLGYKLVGSERAQIPGEDEKVDIDILIKTRKVDSP